MQQTAYSPEVETHRALPGGGTRRHKVSSKIRSIAAAQRQQSIIAECRARERCVPGRFRRSDWVPRRKSADAQKHVQKIHRRVAWSISHSGGRKDVGLLKKGINWLGAREIGGLYNSRIRGGAGAGAVGEQEQSTRQKQTFDQSKKIWTQACEKEPKDQEGQKTRRQSQKRGEKGTLPDTQTGGNQTLGGVLVACGGGSTGLC